MTAQNVAHHQRLSARGADILRRSAELRKRSHQARTVSQDIRRRVREFSPNGSLRAG